jgi:hypothetical protein
LQTVFEAMASSSPRLPGFLRRSLRADYSYSEDEADDFEAADQSSTISSSQQPEQTPRSPEQSSPEPPPEIQVSLVMDNSADSSSFNSYASQRASLPASMSIQPIDRQSSETSSVNKSSAHAEGEELHRQRSASAASSSQVISLRTKSYRETQFEKIFAANVISMTDLKTVAWNGIPVG